MFSWQHFVWLFICLVGIVTCLFLYRKKRPPFKKVLNYCLVICFLSEFIKVFSTIEMVPSADGSIIYPYIPMNHLPLHLCSIQILMILYVRFTGNEKMRDYLLSFMYPSCVLGAIAALAMPSIFSTTISVDQAFTHPMAYQFFIFHSMLIVLGFIIAWSGEVEWTWKKWRDCLVIIAAMAFISLYVNSMLAQPTYLNGQLQHIDFWPNFFFTYQNPLGIKLTKLWQWHLYLVILCVVVLVLAIICFYPLIGIKKKKQ
ncbi:MAG: YwaF family protein [Erysipelotrichaceae bacterium]|nr:YwaF family protein [Erysipelotrichaceae bacterium]